MLVSACWVCSLLGNSYRNSLCCGPASAKAGLTWYCFFGKSRRTPLVTTTIGLHCLVPERELGRPILVNGDVEDQEYIEIEVPDELDLASLVHYVGRNKAVKTAVAGSRRTSTTIGSWSEHVMPFCWCASLGPRRCRVVFSAVSHTFVGIPSVLFTTVAKRAAFPLVVVGIPSLCQQSLS
jgi:hypothetical protein